MLKTFCLFVVLFSLVSGSSFGAPLTSETLEAASAPGPCSASFSDTLQLHVPVIDFQGNAYWVDLQYVLGTLDFLLTNAGAVGDLAPYVTCGHATLSENLTLHLPSVILAGASYWADLAYTQGLTFTLAGAGIVGLPTAADFVGTWTGNIVVEGEPRTMTLTLDGALQGTSVTVGSSRTDINNMSGTVSDGILSLIMAVSNAEKYHPDCINWDVTCSGILSGDDWSVMTMTCSGIQCGAGGGQPFSHSITVTKQQTAN